MSGVGAWDRVSFLIQLLDKLNQNADGAMRERVKFALRAELNLLEEPGPEEEA